MPSHVIETDFEPDDAIAILAHASQYTDIDLTVIVGESQPRKKIPLVKRFFNALKLKYPNAYNSVTIFQGIGSNKKYPELSYPTFIATSILPDPGVEIRNTILRNYSIDDGVPQEDSEQTIFTNYVNAYAVGPTMAFMMKPPREAIKLRIQCPNTVVYCYGSFNWRTLKLETKEYQDLMSRYSKFYYFDSFTAIGEKNSGLFEPSTNDVNNQIKDLIVKWNNHIIEDCKKDLVEMKEKETPDEKAMARTQKIIDNITTAGVEKQFVMADVCLFMCPLPTEQVELESISPYPKWVPSPTSNIFIFDANTEQRRAKLVESLTALTA